MIDENPFPRRVNDDPVKAHALPSMPAELLHELEVGRFIPKTAPKEDRPSFGAPSRIPWPMR